ncbi:hypothetical protein ACE6H2_002310 [Prunus campanulata]
MEKMDSNAMAIQNLLGDRNPTVVSPNQGSSNPKGTGATPQPLEMSLKSGVLLRGQTSGQNKTSACILTLPRLAFLAHGIVSYSSQEIFQGSRFLFEFLNSVLALPANAQFKDIAWFLFGRSLAIANFLYFSIINLFGFLIPRFLPRAFERYFKEREEAHAKMAANKHSVVANKSGPVADKKDD